MAPIGRVRRPSSSSSETGTRNPPRGHTGPRAPAYRILGPGTADRGHPNFIIHGPLRWDPPCSCFVDISPPRPRPRPHPCTTLLSAPGSSSILTPWTAPPGLLHRAHASEPAAALHLSQSLFPQPPPARSLSLLLLQPPLHFSCKDVPLLDLTVLLFFLCLPFLSFLTPFARTKAALLFPARHRSSPYCAFEWLIKRTRSRPFFSTQRYRATKLSRRHSLQRPHGQGPSRRPSPCLPRSPPIPPSPGQGPETAMHDPAPATRAPQTTPCSSPAAPRRCTRASPSPSPRRST